MFYGVRYDEDPGELAWRLDHGLTVDEDDLEEAWEGLHAAEEV